MSLSPRLKPYEVYPIAVRAEMDAAAIYRQIHGRIRNEVLRQKLDFLAREEDRHKAILERLFRDHFPERTLVVPDAVPGRKTVVVLGESASVIDLFKLAMSKEKEAEEFYKDAKAKVEDAQSKRILTYLSRVERSHYYMLRSEVDILEKFPDYYNVEDAYEGQDLFHIGA